MAGVRPAEAIRLAAEINAELVQLEHAAAEISSLRATTEKSAPREELLGTLLGFRHVVRNLYSWRLDMARVDEIAATVPAAHAGLVVDLGTFREFLGRLAQETSSP